ncbi:MAG: 4Fe-4S double cluster binding domain-containing protein [Anaerolineales bacterium]
MKGLRELRQLAEAEGASFFGVADLAPAHEEIREQGGIAVARFPRAISVGIRLLDAIVDQLPNRAEDAFVAMNYRYHAYDLVNERLDLITSRLSSALQDAGYEALPIAASQTVDGERLLGAFSNKLAAHLAGLGWIGKSCLLVTPEAGPRVRWATILTDAPLEPTGEAMEEHCGDCQECVDVCPQGAFSGRPFRPEEPRAMRFDVHKCKTYFNELSEAGQVPVCGMCLYVCPHGRT